MIIDSTWNHKQSLFGLKLNIMHSVTSKTAKLGTYTIGMDSLSYHHVRCSSLILLYIGKSFDRIFTSEDLKLYDNLHITCIQLHLAKLLN